MENKQIKILAIDDNKDNLVVLEVLINDLFPDAIFIGTESGETGFELCQVEKPDIVLVDIVMAEMDGYEVCLKLKSNDRLRHMPVIMVTTNRTDSESRVKALETGADAFLSKPVDKSELKAQINAMLRIKNSEDLKKAEKEKLENIVLERTEALEIELADRKKAEKKLIHSLDKLTRNRQAILNLMEDLKTEIDEKRRVEASLKSERNLLRTLIDNLPDTVYVLDNECRKVIANKADVEIIGCESEADVLGKTDLEMFPDEKGKRFYSESMNVIRTGTPKIDFVEKFTDKNDRIRFLSTSQIPLYDIDGQILGLVGIGHDITETKNANDQLRESEERYRMLIENQGEGVGVVDLDEKFVFVNPAAEEMFGVGSGGLLNQNLLDFVKSDQVQILTKENKIRSKAEKSSYELNITRFNGEVRTLLITATPQLSKDGKLTGTFGVFRDITERKQLEDKIMESEAYYRTLVDISPDGILTTNAEGKVTYGSKKSHDIFGIPAGMDVIGSSILNWISPEDVNSVMERFSNIISGYIIPETKEYKLIKHDRSSFWGELSSSPLTDKNGVFTGLLIVCRDITNRKKAEEDLIKARDKAEESDRLKTAFLHNISHEIRTPMNAITGFSALLHEPGIDAETQHSFLDVITQSSNHLLAIVTDIIEISNIEAGLLSFNKKEINLNSIFKKLTNEFTGRALEKGIEFKFDTGLDDRLSIIQMDSDKLSQILLNLLNNAFKFTERGLIKTGYRRKNDFLEFNVSDSGIGIPHDHQMRIFERFYQVESTLSRQYEGTGLGLPISKAYVELMGGTIWLESEPGKGSVFYFTIPYIPSGADETEGRHVPENQNNISNGKKTILIAEDEENNYLLLLEFLSSLDVDLLHAKNGKEAVEICESGKVINLVLMDIKMPVMDGYTATREIRKMFPDLPVIALTAYSFEDDRKKAALSGCNDFISKPFSKTVLLETVTRYLYFDITT